VLAVVSSVREKAWSDLGPAVWAAMYVALFALLLPVSYQHGRYQIPVIPVLVILGWQGIRQAVRGAATPAVRVLTRTWAFATIAVTMAFVVIGARAYAADVALIETEMVEPARWIAAHTEPQALVAAHDIGALGFFGERQVLDLAGLAEADVIPFLRDEARLAEYMTERGADYLMTFPGWYPELVRCAQVVYDSRAPFGPRQGGENMRVYRWPPAPLLPSEGCMLYSPSPDGAAFAGDE
jgi:hypothetical protein